jgi:hypothetical protein
MGCRLTPGGACSPISVAPDQDISQPPVAAGAHIAWIDTSPGQQRLRLCHLGDDPSRCELRDLGLPPALRASLTSDGRHTLAWSARDTRIHIESCRLSRAGECDLQRVPKTFSLSVSPSASGDLVAWREPLLTGDGPLLACRHEVSTGRCDPVTVLESAIDEQPRVSGDVIVFEGRLGDEEIDVFYCEFDALRKRCPVQRLTAELLRQAQPDVDGRRVVWVDERLGGQRIAGIELPEMRAFARPTAPPGQPVFVHGLLHAAGDTVPTVRAERTDPSGEAQPETMDVALVTRVARDWYYVRTRWCPLPDDEGERLITLEAEAGNGLVTRSTVALLVADGGRAKLGPRRGGLGRACRVPPARRHRSAS